LGKIFFPGCIFEKVFSNLTGWLLVLLAAVYWQSSLLIIVCDLNCFPISVVYKKTDKRTLNLINQVCLQIF